MEDLATHRRPRLLRSRPRQCHGGNGDPKPVFLVRRTAFEAVGGYPTGLVAGCERQALAVRIAAAGYCCDVLPEILNTRHVPARLRRPIRSRRANRFGAPSTSD